VNAIPFLRYDDPAAAIDWLSAAFGFECNQVERGENGTIAHAELRFEDGMVMLGSARDNELGMKTARELGAVTQGIYLIVDAGIDVHFERAVAAGAEVVRALHDTDYGSRDYAVKDPEGNLWDFGTYRPAAAAPAMSFAGE
jgi:uncharacterized glyoxalase superfamily protein PhnB